MTVAAAAAAAGKVAVFQNLVHTHQNPTAAERCRTRPASQHISTRERVQASCATWRRQQCSCCCVVTSPTAGDCTTRCVKQCQVKSKLNGSAGTCTCCCSRCSGGACGHDQLQHCCCCAAPATLLSNCSPLRHDTRVEHQHLPQLLCQPDIKRISSGSRSAKPWS